jgi:Mrp family chromosome partitioning ATPase
MGDLRQLPRDIKDFTGRGELLASLERLLVGAHEQQTAAVPVVVITGKPGVGKSALAVHLAHKLAGSFPDGQLFVRLRGSTQVSVDPSDILVDLLRALDVHRGAIPKALDQQAALYRGRLASRRVLVVLDDAQSPAQVRPLLPGSSSCAALVTAREPSRS